MEKWCFMVSDYCREACPIAVFNNGLLLSRNFLESIEDVIQAFLSKHEEYSLRLVCREDEIEKLEEEGYSFLNMLSDEEEKDFIRKYKVKSE